MHWKTNNLYSILCRTISILYCIFSICIRKLLPFTKEICNKKFNFSIGFFNLHSFTIQNHNRKKALVLFRFAPPTVTASVTVDGLSERFWVKLKKCSFYYYVLVPIKNTFYFIIYSRSSTQTFNGHTSSHSGGCKTEKYQNFLPLATSIYLITKFGLCIRPGDNNPPIFKVGKFNKR